MLNRPSLWQRCGRQNGSNGRGCQNCSRKLQDVWTANQPDGATSQRSHTRQRGVTEMTWRTIFLCLSVKPQQQAKVCVFIYLCIIWKGHNICWVSRNANWHNLWLWTRHQINGCLGIVLHAAAVRGKIMRFSEEKRIFHCMLLCRVLASKQTLEDLSDAATAVKVVKFTWLTKDCLPVCVRMMLNKCCCYTHTYIDGHMVKFLC